MAAFLDFWVKYIKLMPELVPTYLKKCLYMYYDSTGALVQKLISQHAILPSRQNLQDFWEGREG
jgi:hypothetical protein